MAGIAIYATIKGVKWAKTKLTKLYNEAKKKKSSKKSKTSHAQDRAGKRQISQDMIRQTIKNGKRGKGKQKGTSTYSTKKITVVVNDRTGKVITVYWR